MKLFDIIYRGCGSSSSLMSMWGLTWDVSTCVEYAKEIYHKYSDVLLWIIERFLLPSSCNPLESSPVDIELVYCEYMYTSKTWNVKSVTFGDSHDNLVPAKIQMHLNIKCFQFLFHSLQGEDRITVRNIIDAFETILPSIAQEKRGGNLLARIF